MYLPIGVITDCFRLPIGQALEKAAQLGVRGVQIYAVSGELAPEYTDAHNRRELLKRVKDNGLTISALCGDLGGGGFIHREQNKEKIERSKRILDLAKDLETNIVTTHIGVVPADQSSERFQVMQEACYQLSQYADSLDAHFAIETGPEPAQTLCSFLDSLHSTGVAVNLDPANLVMVAGDDPVEAVYTLRNYIVHTHAKDGRQLAPAPARAIYDGLGDEVPTDPSYIELPLGQGDVDWSHYLYALQEIGYRGFLTIEREVGDQPEADIRLAIDFLQNQLQSI